VLGSLAGTGLTAIGAIAGLGGGPWAVFGNEVEAIAAAAATTPIRIGVFVAASDPTRLAAAADLLDTAGPRVEFLGVKIFADGSLGGHTAAMHEPFTDRPDAVGTLRLDPKRDRALAEAALERGSRVAIHAIGDRAVGAVLDLFADLITAGADSRMLRIEHASVLAPGDVARFAELGIAVVVQPAFLTSEAGWLEARVGARRLPFTYPFRTLFDAGVTLAGSSDCPVEPPFPLHGIAAARDRAGIVPAEGLDAGAALGLFTTGAARVAGWPEPLAAASPADFTVIDRDPLAASPDELRKARILATWVDGMPVTVPPDVAPWKE
jgi:predicted amidohydrolase YtcJ